MDPLMLKSGTSGRKRADIRKMFILLSLGTPKEPFFIGRSRGIFKMKDSVVFGEK